MFSTLLYHLVDRTISDKNAITEEAFTDQLSYLHTHNYHVLSLTQAIDILNGKELAPPRAVLLTFDDGYTNNLSVALPLLQSYGMVATLFVISAYIGQNNRWNPKAPYDVNHMTWDELRLWQKAGCDVGSHTHTHLCMTRLNALEVHDEVTRCKQLLEEQLQTPMRAFSYPYGAYNTLTRHAVCEHYEMAFAVDNGVVPSSTQRHVLHRLSVHPKWGVGMFAHHLERTITLCSVVQS